jgi:hypothetical protein
MPSRAVVGLQSFLDLDFEKNIGLQKRTVSRTTKIKKKERGGIAPGRTLYWLIAVSSQVPHILYLH